MSAEPYPNCFPSLGETCGNCHRCTPHEERPMTDHPAPDPNQPDALVEVHAKVVDEHYTVTDRSQRERKLGGRVDYSRRCHCGHKLPWAGHELAMEQHRLAMALAAVLPEVERRAKADALREYVAAARENRSLYQWEPSEVLDDLEQWATGIEKGAHRG